MKIALALSGLFNNIVDPQSGIKGFNYLKSILLEKYNVDVFIYSQDLNNEFLITELYKPVYSTFEKQVNFSDIMKEHNISQEYFDEGFNRSVTMFYNCKIESTLSMLYGRDRVINLVDLYERKKKIKYDIVILARFDCGNRNPNWEGHFHVDQMLFDETLDMNRIYCAAWDQFNCGMTDQWFFSNSDNMKKMGKAYISALKAFKEGSLYEHMVTTGWPDSVHYENHFDPNEKKQFTNEIFKEYTKRSKDLMKYPKWQCINNHIFYKYFLIEQGFYPNMLGFTVS